ncbi:ABC transporter permease [candidate division KSB1 bacterium]
MFGNYLRIALRNVKKQKAYAFINIAGLAVGLASCILILLYVISELSYDRYHDNADRIYRIGVEGNLGGNYVKFPVSNLGSGPAMQKDFPEVESITRIYPRGKAAVKYGDNIFFEENWFLADENFFKVFTFPLIEGDPNTALKAPKSVVITEDFAKKYFGDEPPMGKNISIRNMPDYTVTGVMQNVPDNSHFKFDFLVSLETYYVMTNRQAEEWNNFNNYTYALLNEGVNLTKFQEKFPPFIERYMAQMYKLTGGNIDYFLQPVTSIHLHSNLGYELDTNSDITYVYVFSAIAFLILLIACINFMNLSTARSAGRAREVGLRKVMGADKASLIKQFLGESMLYSIFSLLIALGLVKLAIPVFSSLSGNDLGFRISEMPWLIPAFFGFTILTGILAGSYPAFFLSSFQPVKVMRGALKAGAASSRFRSVLVIFQFIISVSLIVGTTVMISQLNYMKSKSLGFDKERVVVISINENSIRENIESIKIELKSHSNIISAASSSTVPGNYPDYSAYVPEGYTLQQTQLMYRVNADADFIPVMGMEVIAGRNFSREFGTDPENAMIINETAAKKYGWDDPVGKKIGVFQDNGMMETEPRTVIGMVRDFHIKSLHDKILPLLFTNNNTYLNELSLRIKPDDIQGTLAYLKNMWAKYDPSRPFDYRFLDQEFDGQYKADERLSIIIRYFTIFAIFVACLGLYGMASFMAEQRTKEIGIRKALGASVPNIMLLLSKEVTRLILVSNIIAIPVAYFVLNRWLETFAYRTGINVYTFIISMIVVFFIGYATISYQSVKASLANPVDSIRTE